MKIYTTYFAKVSKLPSNIIPVSIAYSTPKGWNKAELKKLAPPWYIVRDYKNSGNTDAYIEQYKKCVLNNLNPKAIIAQLKGIACVEERVVQTHDGFEIIKTKVDRDVALVCYEKSSDFCHRHLVADWLSQYGYDVNEF